MAFLVHLSTACTWPECNNRATVEAVDAGELHGPFCLFHGRRYVREAREAEQRGALHL